jgi:transposase InsO family protein
VDVHKNARLTPKGRGKMVARVLAGERVGAVAAAFSTTVKTVAKWAGRFLAEGAAGLEDRSSRPRRLRKATPIEVIEQIIALRRQRFTGRQIAKETGVSRSTVSRLLRAARLSRIRDLEPPAPVIRYEREHPGELIHLDIKKLGRFDQAGHRVTGRGRQPTSRGAGWDFVHVCIDDASRVAFSQVLPNERGESAVPFLKAAVAYYRSLGVTVARVMTDNGACYISDAFRQACKDLGLKHIRTRPYTPKTNGKAERFIQTALREWAYAKAYPSSKQRTAELPDWLHRYNWHRPHGGIDYQTPISRLALTEDNLLRLHS